jgi:hypothetical protein
MKATTLASLETKGQVARPPGAALARRLTMPRTELHFLVRLDRPTESAAISSKTQTSRTHPGRRT